MSASDDKNSKTEEPTPRRLREARKKAQVSRSDELVPLLMVLFSVMYFYLSFDWMLDKLQDYFSSVGTYAYDRTFKESLALAFKAWYEAVILPIMLPFAFLMFAAGVMGNMLQFGFVFSFDPVIPKPEKIHPVKGFKRIFSLKQVVKTVLSVLKITGMAIIIIFVVRTAIHEYMHEISQCPINCQLGVLTSMLKKMMFILVPILVLMVLLDVAYQKFQFRKDQRMTKDEVKREHKNMEGDPMIKGQRRVEMRRILQEDIREQVLSSRIIIAGNRKAAALMYEEGMELPVLVAIGRDRMSYEMIKIAKKENVPVKADPALVQLLEDEGLIDQFIPTSAIKRVAAAMTGR